MEYIQNNSKGGVGTLKHYVEQTLLGFEYKIVFSIIATTLSVIEGFYSKLLWGFLLFFMLDLLTGIMKSVKNEVPISSKRLRDSVTKLGAYMVLITSLIIASRYENSFAPIVTVAYYYFMFTELKSIAENVQEMGVKIPRFLMNKIDSKIDDIDQDGERIERIRKMKNDITGDYFNDESDKDKK